MRGTVMQKQRGEANLRRIKLSVRGELDCGRKRKTVWLVGIRFLGGGPEPCRSIGLKNWSVRAA